MKVLTYTDQQITDILRVLAALLHLGNLQHQGSLPPLDEIESWDLWDFGMWFLKYTWIIQQQLIIWDQFW